MVQAKASIENCVQFLHVLFSFNIVLYSQLCFFCIIFYKSLSISSVLMPRQLNVVLFVKVLDLSFPRVTSCYILKGESCALVPHVSVQTEGMWFRLRSKLPTWKNMLSSGLVENWHPATPGSSWLMLKPGRQMSEIKHSSQDLHTSQTDPHHLLLHCLLTFGSHCADGKYSCGTLGHGHH